LVLWHSKRRDIPFEFRPLAAKEAARDRCRIAGIDRCPGRTGGPESQPAKLQTRRGLPSAFFDEIERKAAKFRVLLLVEHLKAIDNGANRADHIVTDSGAKKRGEVEGVEGRHDSSLQGQSRSSSGD